MLWVTIRHYPVPLRQPARVSRGSHSRTLCSSARQTLIASRMHRVAFRCAATGCYRDSVSWPSGITAAQKPQREMLVFL
jgi:hypothetical protein